MSLWSDPFIESLSPLGKLLYLYLITSPHTNNMGILEVSRKRIAIDTGMSDKDVAAEIDVLKKTGKLVEVDGVFWLTKFISNQTSCSPKIVDGLKRISEQIKSTKLRRMIWELYPYALKAIPTDCDDTDTLSDGIDTVSKGMDTIGIPTAELELEVEVESEVEIEEEEEQEVEVEMNKIPLPTLYGQAVEIWNRVMPEYGGLQPHAPSPLARRNFDDRVSEDPDRADLKWWRALFNFVLKSSFLLNREGRKGKNGRVFKASFDWLIAKEETLSNVISSKYHDEEDIVITYPRAEGDDSA
jgi:hypothetical protein